MYKSNVVASSKIGVHAFTNLVAVWQQVPVDIEGGLDLRVAHELLNRLRVRACVDQQRGKCMAALVEGDRIEQDGCASLPLRRFARELVGGSPSTLTR